ncbi:MAG: efflux RND transporter permease subunit, partial [Hyphomicrobiaceae bacterium]|nr:efflux RND transporter permease subunit [Hyphomicrobiaceae bacterium]
GAIVMVEYADRKIDEGLPPREAYIRAAKLMFWPIVSSTATTLVAFLPMLLWPGVPGEFMSYLPIMVIIVLTAALATAMIFLPVTGALVGESAAWLGRRAGYVYLALLAVAAGLAAFAGLTALGLTALATPLGLIAALATAIGFSRRFAALNEHLHEKAELRAAEKAVEAAKLSSAGHFDPDAIRGLTGVYVRTLKPLVSTMLGNIVAIGIVLGLCAGSVYLFTLNNHGVEFFVEEEPDVAVVLISARGNLSAEETRDLVVEVEGRILDVEGIASMLVTSTPLGASGGGGGGGPGEVQDKPADLVGQIQLELANFCCRRRAEEIFDEIRARTADLAGIRVEIRKIEGGPPTGKDIRLEVRGADYDTILRIARQVRAHVDTVDGLVDIEDDTPLPGIEWQVVIDREEAGRFGAAIASVGPMMQLVTNGVLIDRYRPSDSDDEVEIRVRLPEAERSLERLDTLRLTTPEGQVPISNFIERRAEPLVSAITRKDGQYVMTVKANVAEGLLANDMVGELQTWLDAQEWPEGVFFRFRGADEEQQESGAFLAKAMVGSLFMMFIILVTQYNSFYQTAITLLTVILSVFGVLLGMALTGQTFSIIMSGTGVVALAGIVVNNAIVLIDTYNRFREEGLDVIEGVLKTAAQRIRPIMLTTITTIAGLVPMATQINFDFFNRVINVGSITSTWWVQLSTAVISGLAFSTILTLVVVPVLLSVPTVWGPRVSMANGVLKTRIPLYRALADRFREPHRPQEPAGIEPVTAADEAKDTVTPFRAPRPFGDGYQQAAE